MFRFSKSKIMYFTALSQFFFVHCPLRWMINWCWKQMTLFYWQNNSKAIMKLMFIAMNKSCVFFKNSIHWHLFSKLNILWLAGKTLSSWNLQRWSYFISFPYFNRFLFFDVHQIKLNSVVVQQFDKEFWFACTCIFLCRSVSITGN